MKYQISAVQRHFFEKNKYIEFEQMLTLDEQILLSLAYEKAARDVAISNQKVQKVLFSPRFGQIAYELSLVKPLRYGLDEIITETSSFSCYKDERCVQGLEIAVLLYINPNEAKAGNALFFLPSESYEADIFDAKQTWLVLGFANKDALYVCNLKDPHTHNLKRQGYVFGDRLKEKTHPVLWR